jgi:TBC1 domain family member 5
VRRLPDEPFYHQDRIQAMIIDVLFIYCKLNPKSGGYRQGMHELLAPVIYVVDQDAIDLASIDPESADDVAMGDVLDSAFVEHDASAIFSRIMDRAQSFYEVKDPISKSVYAATTGREEASAIVEKSRYIHEICLAKVDPELANHLKSIEILPQIFLM